MLKGGSGSSPRKGWSDNHLSAQEKERRCPGRCCHQRRCMKKSCLFGKRRGNFLSLKGPEGKTHLFPSPANWGEIGADLSKRRKKKGRPFPFPAKRCITDPRKIFLGGKEEKKKTVKQRHKGRQSCSRNRSKSRQLLLKGGGKERVLHMQTRKKGYLL